MAKVDEVPRVNITECCGCGLCSIALPDVFRLTPESKSEAYAPDKADRKAIQKVIDDCPCCCIHWFKGK
ncbi:MAG: ferredoxin [Asgard group archaeon]|nr:ferredoxin [Asgard group archaeon]